MIGDDGEEEVLEPMVATYNAYAASLLTEHGLRIGHEPDTRVVSDAARYQLAGRVIDRFNIFCYLIKRQSTNIYLSKETGMAKQLMLSKNFFNNLLWTSDKKGRIRAGHLFEVIPRHSRSHSTLTIHIIPIIGVIRVKLILGKLSGLSDIGMSSDTNF